MNTGHGHWTWTLDTDTGHGHLTQTLDTDTGHEHWTQTFDTNTRHEHNPDQCCLLTDNHICTITELYVHRVRSTERTLITLVQIGYATRSKYIRVQRSYYITGVK